MYHIFTKSLKQCTTFNSYFYHNNQVFNLHLFKQCTTFNSHLYHNNLSLKCRPIRYTSPEVKFLSFTYNCTIIDTLTTSLKLQRDMSHDDHLTYQNGFWYKEATSYSNHRLWYHWWVTRKNIHINSKITHKERHYIFTKKN